LFAAKSIAGAIHLIKCNCWERTCSGEKKKEDAALLQLNADLHKSSPKVRERESCISANKKALVCQGPHSSLGPRARSPPVLILFAKSLSAQVKMCSLQFFCRLSSPLHRDFGGEEKFIIEENLLSASCFACGARRRPQIAQVKAGFVLVTVSQRALSSRVCRGAWHEENIFDMQRCQAEKLGLIYIEASSVAILIDFFK